jgi:alkylation response protein AidB-like acyl-CoA dehydrogenase
VNFGVVELDPATQAFWDDCRVFFEEHVTEAVHEEERRTGSGFNEGLHLAMGARGWLTPGWPAEEGGADLDPVRRRILEHELERSGAPAMMIGVTQLPVPAIRAYAREPLRTDVLRGIADGTVRICLGYTEPDCGSDLAGVRLRSTRDGDQWVLSGQKMFTTGAQICRYAFCLTRSNPDAPKHKGLTVFLVPLDLDGIEITPIWTVGGERTNFVHFDDVRVPDDHRIGDVDAGWTVMSAPLADEHRRSDAESVDDPGSMYGRYTRRLLHATVEQLGTDGRLDDPQVLERLGRAALDLEVDEATPGPMGRVVTAEVLLRHASALLDLVGPAALLAHGADGAVAGAVPEHLFRFAPGTSIYGGTTDIFRNMIAEQVLGLPRSTPRR